MLLEAGDTVSQVAVRASELYDWGTLASHMSLTLITEERAEEISLINNSVSGEGRKLIPFKTICDAGIVQGSILLAHILQPSTNEEGTNPMCLSMPVRAHDQA